MPNDRDAQVFDKKYYEVGKNASHLFISILSEPPDHLYSHFRSSSEGPGPHEELELRIRIGLQAATTEDPR